MSRSDTSAASTSSRVASVGLREPWWRPIAEFATHMVVGTAIFIFVAVPAVILHLATEFLVLRNLASQFVVMGLRGIEYAMFTADLVLCGIFIFRTALKLGRRMTNAN